MPHTLRTLNFLRGRVGSINAWLNVQHQFVGILLRPLPLLALHVVIAVATGVVIAMAHLTLHPEEAVAAMAALVAMGVEVAPAEVLGLVGREQARLWFTPLPKFSL